MVDIYVACNGDWDEPEVQISGSWKDLAELGLNICQLESSYSLNLSNIENPFYPVNIGEMYLQVTQTPSDRLQVSVDRSKFELSGSTSAFKKLGQSLTNFFDRETIIGDHFQLDYYEENQMLEETNCHLFFVCDR